MKGRLKVKVDREPRAFFRAFMAAEEPIARAATAAVGEAGERIKAAARADIAAAGFSRKWQNALRVDHYPRGREVSVNAAAHVYQTVRKRSVAGLYGALVLRRVEIGGDGRAPALRAFRWRLSCLSSEIFERFPPE